ncbi:MAG: hypothetical protein M5U01_07205 [Ardenticatenaceae bacterium]|nr:hypothetical protein [Ardenticatenaceae bacterium]
MSDRSSVSPRWLLAGLLVFLLAACTNLAPTLPPPTVTPPPTSRPLPTATPTEEPTTTPAPTATPTEKPTATVITVPSATPTGEIVATSPATDTILTDHLYANRSAGVRWEAPADDWQFVELPAGTFGRSDMESLVTLMAPDGQTSFSLAFLSFKTQGLDELGAAISANPDAFFEQTKKGLPAEAAETAEQIEVAGSPALRMTLHQGAITQRVHLILRPNGAFYLIAQARGDLDAAIVETGIATLTFTPLRQMASPTPESPPASLEEQRTQIISAVEQLRELKSLTPVPFEFMDRDALRTKLKKDLAEETDQAELAASDQIYKLLDLIPAHTDLTDLMLDLYSSQIAGFYDPKEDRFYLISEPNGELLSAADRVTFAHEYVHALQDQHYDLEALTADEKKLNADQERAIQAVVEGDAETVTGLYMVHRLSHADLSELLTSVSELDQETLEKTPRFLRESLVFPYTLGQAFVQARLAIGGWAAVDALYTTPPQSTEQILHPERYPDDAPQAVTLPDLPVALGGHWQEQSRETWGEFDLRLLLAEHLPEAEALRGAEGWGGDQYLLLHDDAGNGLFVLDIVWDRPDDAIEFARSFAEWLKRAGYQEQPDGHWQADGRGAALQQADNRTTVLVATRATDLRSALAALGTGND